MTTYTIAQYLTAGTASAGAEILDSAADIQAGLDALEPYAAAGDIASVHFTDSGSPRIYVSVAQNAADAAVIALFQGERTVEVTGATVAQTFALQSQQHVAFDIADTGATIKSNIDALGDLANEITSVTITDGTIPSFSFFQAIDDSGVISHITIAGIGAAKASANLGAVLGMHGFAVSDSAANVAANLDGLETLDVASKLSGITLTDGGSPTLAVSPVQMLRDAGAIETIQGSFTLAVDGSTANLVLTAPTGVATELVLSGTPDQYSVSLSSDGKTMIVTDTATGRSSTDYLTGFTAVAFEGGGVTLLASDTPVSGATVSSAEIASLYAAVLARTPDVAGLAFYEKVLAAEPSLTLTDFAQWFLASPEYTANAAHSYAETAAGEAQFITDSYNNLLHRAPESGAVAFYQNVIAQYTANLTAGTAAYAAADALAHATVLAYFSGSPEFLADVKITAQASASAEHWLLLS